ncbi:MAG: hypothetical protein ACI957_004650, partial [Verrucomicrobiales bacterium]
AYLRQVLSRPPGNLKNEWVDPPGVGSVQKWPSTGVDFRVADLVEWGHEHRNVIVEI